MGLEDSLNNLTDELRRRRSEGGDGYAAADDGYDHDEHYDNNHDDHHDDDHYDDHCDDD